MLHRAFRAATLATVALTFAIAAPTAATDAVASAEQSAQPSTVDPPPITVNPFIPEDRGISDCISALPKPGCGSEARGGWRQGLIFLALIGGLAIIGWRIVAGVRSGGSSRGTPATSPDPASDPSAAPLPPTASTSAGPGS